MENFAYNAYFCHCERDTSCHMTCLFVCLSVNPEKRLNRLGCRLVADSRGHRVLPVHTGATWRTRLKDPCSAAMRAVTIPFL